MTHPDPEQRPTAKEVLSEWLKARDTILAVHREWRPRPRIEHVVETMAFDAMSLCNISVYFVQTAIEILFRR